MRRVWLIVVITFLFVVTVSIGGTHIGSGFHTTSSGFSENPLSATSSGYYNQTAAVDYGMLIFKDYAQLEGLFQQTPVDSEDIFSRNFLEIRGNVHRKLNSGTIQ